MTAGDRTPAQRQDDEVVLASLRADWTQTRRIAARLGRATRAKALARLKAAGVAEWNGVIGSGAAWRRTGVGDERDEDADAAARPARADVVAVVAELPGAGGGHADPRAGSGGGAGPAAAPDGRRQPDPVLSDAPRLVSGGRGGDLAARLAELNARLTAKPKRSPKDAERLRQERLRELERQMRETR